MPGKNGQNGNGVQKNSKTTLNHSERMKLFRAIKTKKKQTVRIPNSGKFEHLRKFVASYKQNETAYNKIISRKLAQKTSQQNNEPKNEPKNETVIEQVKRPKPETEIKNENNVVIEEPKIQEELQKPADEVTKENEAETVNFEDIKIEDTDLDDPALDYELEKLELQIKKEENLKAAGIDPESVEEPNDSELDEELRELMQEKNEKLEGDALEEAFQSISNEVDGEIKDADANNTEIEDLDVNEEIKHLEEEITAELKANTEPVSIPGTVPVVETNDTEEKDDIIVEDIKEEPEKINIVEESVRTNEIKLLGEEKVEVPVENSEPKPENTAPQSNMVNNTLGASQVQEENLARIRFSDALKRNDPRKRTVRIPVNQQFELSRRDVIIDAVAEDEADFEVDYKISETVSALNENESVNTHRVSMPEYNDLLQARSEKQEITTRAMSVTTNILKAAGLKLSEDSKLVSDTYNKLFATIKDAGTEATMHDLAVKTFEDSYDMLRGAGLKSKEHVVAAQNIANMMLYTYSPIAFMDGEMTQYAESYVAINGSLLRQQLEKNGFSKEECDSLTSNVRIALTGDPEPEPEPKVDGLRYFLKFSKQLEDKRLKERVEKRLAAILKESGVGDGVNIDETAKDILDTNLNSIDTCYNPEFVPSNPTASTLAKVLYTEVYGQINHVASDDNDKIMTTQRVTDVILRNYSPAAFDKKRLGKYANNFIVANKDALEECLIDAQCSKEEIEEVMQRDIKSELRAAYFKSAMRNPDQQDVENEDDIVDEIELDEPIVNEQIESNENVENKPDEITEIKVEEHKEPTLADDFEPVRNNSNEPEVIKIVEDLPEKPILNNPEEKQVNPEPAKLDTHALFKQIENNVLNPKKEKNVVVEPKPKEEPKPVYSVPPIPGMRSNSKQKNISDAPKLTEEERQAKELADAKVMLEHLRKNRTGTTEEHQERARMINYYQGIVNKHKSLDELFNESREVAEKARRKAKEREEREKQLKELENAAKNDIIEGKENENEPLDIRNEDEELAPLRIEDFYDKLRLSMDNTNVAAQVRAELTDIVKAAGITEQEKVFDIVESSYFEIKDSINSMYDSAVTTKVKMSTDAPLFFYNAFISLKNTDLSTKDRIITAQKFADVMLKNYSPVAFADKALDRFADNYTLNNLDLLREQLSNLGFNNQEVGKLINEISGVPENEQHEQPPAEPELTQAEKNRRVFGVNVDQYMQDKRAVNPEAEQEPNPQQNPPVTEPPKPNPVPLQDPSKLGPEWINMPEFDQKLERLKKIAALPGNIKKQISDILTESGVETGGADDPLEFNEIINDAYDPKKLPRDVPQSMRDITKNVFISTYNAISKKGLTPKNKIETTQRITDVFLNLYSPASLSGVKELNKYTQNYVIGDKDLLRECLTTLNLPENEIKAIAGDVKHEAKTEAKTEVKLEVQPQPDGQQAPQPTSNEARVAVFIDKFKAYNSMYKLNIDADEFAASVTEAWNLLISGDKQKMADGQKVMNNLFKDTLKKAFDVEKSVSYDEHRLPEYAEIIKSTNELVRSAMYGFTDMYHNPNRKDLFAATAFGGLNAKEIGELTTGKSSWSMDQKSDEAWDIQAKEAKNIADKWLKEDRPYEKMISEMSALVKAHKKDNLDMQEAYNKLTAAEWLLINNEKMMVENPEDPLNPIPNWGNRYWKTLTETREALGIPKHTSMRDLIQLDYEEIAKAVENRSYNERQIFDGVLDPADREMHDSLDMQKEQFAIQSAAVVINDPNNDKIDEKNVDNPENKTRWKISVSQEDERKKIKDAPKFFGDLVIEKQTEISINAAK